MKNIIKNAVISTLGALAVFAFIGAPAALAQTVTTFNADGHPTVEVSKDGQNWSTSATVDGGGTVYVRVFYHNTGNWDATNTLVKLSPQSTASGFKHVFSGSVVADNSSAAYPASSNATVNISKFKMIGAAQTLTLIPGTIAWHKDQSSSATSFLNGQTGSEIFSSGLNIGTIKSKFSCPTINPDCRIGYVSAKFQVSNNKQVITAGGGNNIDPVNIAGSPTITTISASNVNQNSAIFNGSFNSNGASTTTWFEYGLNSSLGNKTANQVQSSNSGSFTQNISGLQSNTTYFYKACGLNSNGTACGSNTSFTTQAVVNSGSPLVTTNGSSNTSINSAYLNGSFNANGASTTTWFEYSSNFNAVSSGSGAIIGQISQGISSGSMGVSVGGLAANTTYYFRAVAQNSYGLVQGSILNFTTGQVVVNYNNKPIVVTNGASYIGMSGATLNGYVDPQGSYTTRYFIYGTNQNSLNLSTANTGLGTSAGNINEVLNNLSSNTTYFFQAVAYNQYGTSYGNVMSFTTGANVQVNQTVATTFATSIGKTSAKLNGLIVLNSYSTLDYHFEWGRTANLGNSTGVRNIGSSNSAVISETINGLEADTIYFFRAVAGSMKGEILVFKTLSSTSVGNPAPAPATLTSKDVSLKIETTAPNFSVGDDVKFTITYKNITKKTLNNVIVRVMLPKDIKFLKSSIGNFSAEDNTLTVSVGSLDAGKDGTITIEGTVKSGAKDKDLLVTTGSMIFTDANGIDQNVFAYVLNNIVKDNSNLAAASIFGSGGFLPNTAIGWGVLILVILGLAYFGRNLYSSMKAVPPIPPALPPAQN